MATAQELQAFEDKVRAMTFKEIVLAMVAGLRKRYVTIDMETYGWVRDGVCYGCAATNTVCHIAGIVFTPETIGHTKRAKAVNADPQFLEWFELAIDWLRDSRPTRYSIIANRKGFAQAPEGYQPGPALGTDFIEEDLLLWEQGVGNL